MSSEPRISVRVSHDIKTRLSKVAACTGLDETQLVKNCVIALIEHAEQHGSVTFPLHLETDQAQRRAT